MHRYLWGLIVAVLGQIAFIDWNRLSPLGVGPVYTFVLLLQYGGVVAGSVAVFFLARAIRREAAGRRAIRVAAAVAMGLTAITGVLVLAAVVCHLVQSPVELDLYSLSCQVAEVSWLALVVASLTALGLRPRPVLPAILLIVVFLAGMTSEIPLPYNVTGPAGEPDTSYLIEAQGGERHPGRIYGLTLWGGSATLTDYLFALVNPNTVLVPNTARPAMAQEDETLDQMLVDSEAMAKAVGLQLVGRGKGATPTGTGAVVTRILPETPAATTFHPGDLIVGFNGRPVSTWAYLLEQMQAIGPGVPVSFTVDRDGEPQTLTLTTVPNPGNPTKGMVGIQGGDRLDYDIPVPITTAIPPGVGGPSLGLALTLQVVDQLTPGGITNGWNVAATGAILPDGQVGAIGGAKYKAIGAERAGAGVMFVPRANYEEALAGATQILVVPVDTAQDALAWLKAHTR